MGLEHIAPELKRQSLEFADLPDVVGAIASLWQQRWQQLFSCPLPKSPQVFYSAIAESCVGL